MPENVAQCVGMIAQHPPCHVWPAFQAVERISMQSWSPLDVGLPAPGLGGGAGEEWGKVDVGGKGREGRGKERERQLSVTGI